MPYEATVLTVFIASPSDVQEERQVAAEVIHNWNATHAEERRQVLLPLAWEKNSFPAAGTGSPQGEIDKQLLEKSDLLVAVFRATIGGGHTVREIERHRAIGKPTMIYFCTAPVPQQRLKEYAKLRKVRERYLNSVLAGQYASVDEFRDGFTMHLRLAITSSYPSFSPARGQGPSPSG